MSCRTYILSLLLAASFAASQANAQSQPDGTLVNAAIPTGETAQARFYYISIQSAANDAINELKQKTIIQDWLPGSKLDSLHVKGVFKVIDQDDCRHELSPSLIREKLVTECQGENNDDGSTDETYSIVISNFTSNTKINNIVLPYGFYLFSTPRQDFDELTLHYDDNNTGKTGWPITKTIMKLAFLNWYYEQLKPEDTKDNKIAYHLFAGMDDAINDACQQMPNMGANCMELKSDIRTKIIELRHRTGF
jgi:hypothetical protein